MEVRKVQNSDIPEIIDLCEVCIGKPINENHYRWLYTANNGFYSYIMLDNKKIIAHHGIIENTYIYNDHNLIVGLSSGVMILPEYQKFGDFYFLLKESLPHFKGDIIIGFPNENAHGIMRKLFSYKSIPNNFYKLDLKNEIKYIDKVCYDLFARSEPEWRIDKHPSNQYYRLEKGNCSLIYKEYLGDSIDIIYTNVISNDFIDVLSEFSKKYTSINIISIQGNLLEQIGFAKMKGNEFIYKAYNREYEDITFPCQMIDSDVY